MTTNQQDTDFIKTVIGSELLENAIEWIADNLDPADVFGHRQLAMWAAKNGWVQK